MKYSRLILNIGEEILCDCGNFKSNMKCLFIIANHLVMAGQTVVLNIIACFNIIFVDSFSDCSLSALFHMIQCFVCQSIAAWSFFAHVYLMTQCDSPYYNVLTVFTHITLCSSPMVIACTRLSNDSV